MNWHGGPESIVIPTQTQLISKANDLKKTGDYKRQVTVKMIDIGWIYSDGLEFCEIFRTLYRVKGSQK